jgi:hypothetical protein
VCAPRTAANTQAVRIYPSAYLPPLSKKLTYAGNRTPAITERFADPNTQLSIAADLQLIDAYDTQIAVLERHLLKNAKVDDPVTFQLLRTTPGGGPILGLTLLYEIDTIGRFPRSVTSCRIPGWRAAAMSRPARSRGPAAKRSATATSSGPSARRPA